MLALVCAGAPALFAQSTSAAPSGVKPYGNLYLFMGYSSEKTYDSGQNSQTSKDTIYHVIDDSNIGFSFQYAQYSGVFELGLNDSNDTNKVRVLKAYGDYHSDYGDLMVGQAYNPYVRWSNESANLARSKNFGALYDEPAAQLMFKAKFGAYLDIIQPYVPTETYYSEQARSVSGTATDEYTQIKVSREVTTKLERSNISALLPRLAAGYNFSSTMVDFGLGCAMNMYKIESTEGEKFNKSWIKSYIAYSNLQLKYNGFSLLLNGGASVNPANMGISVQSAGSSLYTPGAACAVDNIATGKKEIKDTWNVQAFAELGWEFRSGVNVYAGYGFSAVDYPIENTKRDYAMEYYANIKFNVGGLITLTPSFAYRDNKKDMSGNKEGSETIFGMLATVSFY
jgi:hypothetical protein